MEGEQTIVWTILHLIKKGGMLISYCFSISERMKECLTCVRRTSSVAGVEEDASNNAGASELGRASCGMTGGSYVTIDVC